MKKVEKPLVEEKKQTNGAGGIGNGSGVLDFIKEKSRTFKITKPTMIIIALVVIFILALIIL